ncbi:Teichoic acids export ATP-binding protein TagH [Methylococcales bacterium]|nr:Teichoic acids export ATP-binding protein TagH [Methylococcales bacterium]
MPEVIHVSDLCKTYRLYNSKSDRAADVFMPWGKRRYHNYDALKDISFSIEKGESIGIIGRNGSGKSTLLKILSGVLSPTSGKVEVHGKIASLLELGAGFNPELTGRENIYFNGVLMGCTKRQMEQRIEQIIGFADIGEFIDQPVKIYSSGMFVRLAFAVSVHVEPDILIIDEALAVGDVLFQKKCIDFMRNFQENGNTIVFVSHDIYTVKSFCNRLILINDGKLEVIGEPDTVANRYYQIMFPKTVEQVEHNSHEGMSLENIDSDEKHYRLNIDLTKSDAQWGHGAAWISQLRVGGIRPPNLFGWGDSIEIELVCKWNAAAISQLCGEHGVPPSMLLGFRFENSKGVVLTNYASSMLNDGDLSVNMDSHSECVIRCRIPAAKLAAGHYFLSPGLAIGATESLYPIKEYTNLIHLYCDTSQTVLGLMRADCSMELLSIS